MANSKISALTAATTPVAGTEVLPIVQSSATKQLSIANLTAGRAISATQLTLTTGNLIVASGQGVDFSATPGTGTSELFSDYEEGTWSSALSDGTNSSATSTAYYTKIGRIVYVTIQIYSVNVSALTASATLRITGLPFAPDNYVNGLMSVPFAAAGTILVQTGGSSYVTLYVANGVDTVNWQALTRNIEAGATSMSIYGQFFYIT